MFLRNVGIYLQVDTTQKTNIETLNRTAVGYMTISMEQILRLISMCRLQSAQPS
jgi:hypothetical protein